MKQRTEGSHSFRRWRSAILGHTDYFDNPHYFSGDSSRDGLEATTQRRVAAAEETDDPNSDINRALCPRRAEPPRCPRGRVDLHHARGRGRVRAARAAVLGRQGLDRAAAPRREGVPAGRSSRSRSCTSTPATTSPRCSSSATARVAELGERLIVASVQESIDKGRVRGRAGRDPSRNRLQTTTLLDAIQEHQFDAVFGGGRRDEEKARAKERIFSFRDEFGQWEPQEPAAGAVEPVQRPHPQGRAHARLPHLQLDRDGRLAVHRSEEGLEVPAIYFAHERDVFQRDGMWLSTGPFLPSARRRGGLEA